MNRMNPIGLPAREFIKTGLAIEATGWPPLASLSTVGPQMIQGGIMAQSGNEVAMLTGEKRKEFFFSVIAVGYPIQQGG